MWSKKQTFPGEHGLVYDCVHGGDVKSAKEWVVLCGDQRVSTSVLSTREVGVHST
jgi:hypothetical protein